MQDVILMGIVGGLGGAIRAFVGVRKAMLEKRAFKLGYFLSTIIGAIIIGVIVGSIFGTSKEVALVSGYAGTDLLEGLAKSAKILPARIG